MLGYSGVYTQHFLIIWIPKISVSDFIFCFLVPMTESYLESLIDVTIQAYIDNFRENKYTVEIIHTRILRKM